MTAVASAPMEPGVVRQQLQRILQSRQFVDTTRLARFWNTSLNKRLPEMTTR